MGDHGDLADALEGEVPRGRGAEAVSRRPEPGHTLSLERTNDRVDGGLPAVLAVSAEPAFTIEVGARERVLGDRVALEEVWDDRAVAVAREVIGEKLQRSFCEIGSVWERGTRLALLLISGIPKTSERKRMTLSFG